MNLNWVDYKSFSTWLISTLMFGIFRFWIIRRSLFLSWFFLFNQKSWNSSKCRFLYLFFFFIFRFVVNVILFNFTYLLQPRRFKRLKLDTFVRLLSNSDESLKLIILFSHFILDYMISVSFVIDICKRLSGILLSTSVSHFLL